MTKAAALVLLSASFCMAADLDRDGLSDDFEDALLTKFVPALRISADECDGLPAEFQPGSLRPKVIAKSGTIYGQVFRAGEFLEIHYYHLWSRDCGRKGHPLDAEHVSALLREDGPPESVSAWTPIYWYAAAHEDTLCDSSNGAMAGVLPATDRGASVWISRGKHASFLSAEACARGCGADRCDRATLLSPSKILNIGEPGAPLNGALWAASEHWPLAAKMKSDFNEAVLGQLSATAGVVAVGPPRRSTQAVISASAAPIDAIATGNRHTESALSLANEKTDRAINTSYGRVTRSLARARKAVANALKLGEN